MKLTELAKAVEDGKQIEVYNGSEWQPEKGAQALYDHADGFSSDYRVKPEKKPIDMSVLIQSGIDCEFWSKLDIGKHIGKLSRTQTTTGIGQEYLKSDGSGGLKIYTRCSPRMGDHWHSWQGGECPLPEGLIIKTRLRCRGKSIKEFKHINTLRWHWDHPEWDDTDIIAFKVIGLAEGWAWPWEMDQ